MAGLSVSSTKPPFGLGVLSRFPVRQGAGEFRAPFATYSATKPRPALFIPLPSSLPQHGEIIAKFDRVLYD